MRLFEPWHWLKHRSAFAVMWLYVITAVTWPVMGAAHWGVSSLIWIPIIAFIVIDVFHERTAICDRCMQVSPTTEYLEKNKWPLQYYHYVWSSHVKFYQLGMVVSSCVVGIWVYPLYVIGLEALFIWYVVDWRAVAVHKLLKPWCPWCKGPDHRDHVLDRTPDPAMTKN